MTAPKPKTTPKPKRKKVGNPGTKRGRYKTELTDEALLIIIDKYYGVLPDIAKASGQTYMGMKKRIGDNPALKAACLEARDKIVSIAESQLYKMAAKGNLKAIQYMLSRVGRKNGWTEESTINLRTSIAPDEAKQEVATLFGLKADEPTGEAPESKEDEEA